MGFSEEGNKLLMNIEQTVTGVRGTNYKCQGDRPVFHAWPAGSCCQDKREKGRGTRCRGPVVGPGPVSEQKEAGVARAAVRDRTWGEGAQRVGISQIL